MAEPINLNRARKARAKAADKAQASENRVRFGRTKAQTVSAAGGAEIIRRRLEGHLLREPDEP